MKRFHVALLAVVFGFLSLASTSWSQGLTHEGARLQELDEAIAKAPGQTLAMFLPASDGFAPNITIAIQQYDKPMADYILLSKGQLDEMFVDGKWEKLLEKQEGEVSYRLETAGMVKRLPDKKIHVYCRVFKKGAKLYVITAIALEPQWAKHGKEMTKHVESFKE